MNFKFSRFVLIPSDICEAVTQCYFDLLKDTNYFQKNQNNQQSSKEKLREDFNNYHWYHLFSVPSGSAVLVSGLFSFFIYPVLNFLKNIVRLGLALILTPFYLLQQFKNFLKSKTEKNYLKFIIEFLFLITGLTIAYYLLKFTFQLIIQPLNTLKYIYNFLSWAEDILNLWQVLLNGSISGFNFVTIGKIFLFVLLFPIVLITVTLIILKYLVGLLKILLTILLCPFDTIEAILKLNSDFKYLLITAVIVLWITAWAGLFLYITPIIPVILITLFGAKIALSISLLFSHLATLPFIHNTLCLFGKALLSRVIFPIFKLCSIHLNIAIPAAPATNMLIGTVGLYNLGQTSNFFFSHSLQQNKQDALQQNFSGVVNHILNI